MMTQDEISEALGEGWTRTIPAGCWYRKVNGVTFEVTPEFLGKRCWVDRTRGNDEHYTTYWRCPDDESAVAVAHLLVAAEEISGGAEVASVLPPKIYLGTWKPPILRRQALDLLRAAAEAEKNGEPT